MARVRMRRVSRYSNEFKITSIRLAGLPGTLIQDVAKVLDIHPFMLSRWKKEYWEGKITGDPHPEIEKLTEVEAKVSEQSRIRELERALKKVESLKELLFLSEAKRK
jgi:transposase